MKITFASDTTSDTVQGVLDRLADFAVTVTDTDGEATQGEIAPSPEYPVSRTPYLLLVNDGQPYAEIPYDDIATVEIL
jgi:hypothetical protein